MMDLYLEEANYAKSAQVAIEIMLQEYNENQITMAFSLFSCWNYIDKILKSADAIVEPPASETNKKEEKVVCIQAIANYFF